MKGRVRNLLTALLIALPMSASAHTGWFLHPFGELRAYHGDFLNVCTENGAGACRTVNYVLAPGDTFFGEARLALHRLENGWGIEIWDLDLPLDVTEPFSLSIDGKVLSVDPSTWSDVTPDGVRVAQTLSIVDPTAAAPLVEAMRSGFFLTVRHEAGQAVFSLRGLIAAQTAIDIHLGRMTK